MADRTADNDAHPPATPTGDGNRANEEKAMSFEEFQTMYESYRREIDMRYRHANTKGAGSGGGPAAASSTAAASLTTASSAGPPRPLRGRAANPPNASRSAVMGLLCQAAVNAWIWLTHDWSIYLRIGVATLILNGSLTLVGYLSVLAFYIVFSLLKFIFQSFRIRNDQENGDLEAASPTVLGMVFLGNPPAPRVLPFHLRLAYMAAKSIEAFIVSISPSYSLESLQKGLQRDGIVYNARR